MPFWKCFACMRFRNEEIITKLDHSNCALTDVPPDVSQHERTLEELYLSSNRIRALSPQLFYCQGLKALHVNDNELESLPIAIGSLKQLQSLNLSRNGLSGVPDNIKSCKNLTRLDLSLNNLQRLPDAITSLISLQELLLNETNLEFLPANFGRLVNLRILELRSNNLITLPKSMSRLANLNRIDIGANEFTELPEVICQLSQLRELWIDVNRIRRISPNVSNLRELKHFEANNNLLTTLPNEISHWRNLEVLSVATNDMESLPFSIGMLKSLVTLQCDANHLRELPDSICNLENLEEMVISHNFILRLPSTIGMLRKLRFFCADENILRTLPDELCSCINLAVLSVRSNKITELPQNIGHLVNLHVLNLVDNVINYLPVSVLSLTKLTALWISDNQSQPLVPLQYLNASTKTYLTCFMLPQQGTYQQTAAQTNDYSDNGSTNSWIHRQDQDKPVDVYNFNENAVPSPSHRISFADEKSDLSYISRDDALAESHSPRNCFTNGEVGLNATFAAENGPVTSPSRRICFADEVKGAETLATRLMRSPTPYPKELRLLAKYVRSNHHAQMQQRQAPYIDTLVTAQTMRAPAINTPTDQVDGSKFLTSASSGAVPSADGVKEARVLLNPSGSSGVLQQMQNSLSYNHLDERNMDPKKTQHIKPQPQPMYPNHCNSMSMVNGPQAVYTADNSMLNHAALLAQQQVYYQQYRNPVHQPAPNVKNDQSYPHSLSMYDQQFRDAVYESSGSIRQLNASPSVLSSYSQQGSQQPQNVIYSIEMSKPPPYHIARAFTKKSREDLLNYDTFRSQIHQGDHQDGEVDGSQLAEEDGQRDKDAYDNVLLNGHSHDNSFDNSLPLHGLNDNDYDADHQNNNTHLLNATFSIECEESLISRHGTPSPRIQKSRPFDDCAEVRLTSSRSNQSQQWNGVHSSEDTLDSDGGNQDHLLHVSRPPPRSNSTTAWLFGLHKNPTVKQVAIKRDQEIGFEIKEKPDQGIFVRSIHPNTSAATLLHANDKILEVDGYDFTKIQLVDAQQILDNSGPVINVMISRT